MACLVVCCFLLFVNTRFRRKHDERKKSRLRAPRARSTRRCRADPWGVHGGAGGRTRRAPGPASAGAAGPAGGAAGAETCGPSSHQVGRPFFLVPLGGRGAGRPRPPGAPRVPPPPAAWRPSGDTPLRERPLSERGRPAGGAGTDDRLCASGNHVSQWTTDEDGK